MQDVPFLLEMGSILQLLIAIFSIVLNQGVKCKIIAKNKVVTPIFAADIASEQQY